MTVHYIFQGTSHPSFYPSLEARRLLVKPPTTNHPGIRLCERQPLNDKNKTDPGNLGESLDPEYQSDPYEIKRVKMPVMTSASSPNLVASDASSRMIGCVCEPVADAINWMELVKGDPVKCYCGHWFQLVSYEEYFQRVNCPSAF
ncbi:cytochrome c oxidase subunit Vb [Clonorchis sinensis]|uniref:Cytochrome c oxidase subunit Vb n=1 Tax=Clonorchis sinensis TaxID=79923 RepID=G7YI11_CLOSI|nr:cytochrome c oxidase subunit Vb [Clonorchis sinensis]